MSNITFKETFTYYGSTTINSVPPNCIIRCVSQRDGEDEKNNDEPVHLIILRDIGEGAEVYATGNIKARAAKTGALLSAHNIDINMVYPSASLNAKDKISALMIEEGAIINGTRIPKTLFTSDIKRDVPIASSDDKKDKEKHPLLNTLQAAMAQPDQRTPHTATALNTSGVAIPRPRIKCDSLNDLIGTLLRLIPAGRNEASAEASR